MTALLWARPVFAAILLALVGLYVWTARRADAASEAGHQAGAQR
jgi:cytochrome c-type biogenesis protein CcmH/NrfF